MREITSLDELKSIELDIMKKIHTFCESENIFYVLGYGTLIGAVRHKGFIPWDDDIDILMPRHEYERFMDSFGAFAEENGLYIASNRTKPHMCRAFAKVCDKRTIQYEPKYKDREARGVFVDVWPLDGYPSNRISRKIHQGKLLIEFIALHASFTNLDYIPKEQTNKRALIRLFSKADSEKILEKFERDTRKYPYDNSEWVMCSSTKPELFRRKWFEGRFLTDFEDAQFYAPSGYDEYLRCRYGDYMKLPPVEQQKPHHVIDTYWKEDTNESID